MSLLCQTNQELMLKTVMITQSCNFVLTQMTTSKKVIIAIFETHVPRDTFFIVQYKSSNYKKIMLKKFYWCFSRRKQNFQKNCNYW